MWCNGQDTVRYPVKPMKGIRVGIDVSKPFLPLMYGNERMGFEAAADVYVAKNLFAAAEAGWMRIDLDKGDTAYHYRSNGMYAKAGVDYNMLKARHPYSNDMVYVGFRYGMSVFNREIDNITIPGYYWPDLPGQSIPKATLNAHWIELLMGVRAEVLRNFYVGLTFRIKFKVVSPNDEQSTPYFIPGYGKGNEGYSLGLNYFASYNIKF